MSADDDGKCPYCGENRVVADPDLGERVCTGCGTVVERVAASSSDDFEESAGRGTTVPHLPDKNLPTTFHPSDIKNRPAYEQMRRLERLNKTAPQRESAGTRYRIQKRLRPLLEKMPMLFSASHDRRQRDAIGEVLDYASNLVTKKKPPQEPFVYEALALLATVHSDWTRVIRPGFGEILNSIAHSPGKGLGEFDLRRNSNGWFGKYAFEDSRLLDDTVNIVIRFHYAEQLFTLKAPVQVCLNVVGLARPKTISRRFDAGPKFLATLHVSKDKCALNEPVAVTLMFQPAVVELDRLAATIEAGKKRHLVAKTYNRLCLYYGLPLIPATPAQLIGHDRTLTSAEQKRCTALAEAIRMRMRGRPGFQKLQPRLIAALSIVRSTTQSPKTVAERYHVGHATFERALKRLG